MVNIYCFDSFVEFHCFILGADGMMGAMWKATVLLVLLIVSPGGDGLFHSVYRNVRVSIPQKGDAGQPLFLTPYVEARKLAEGQFHQKTTGILSTVFLFLSNYPAGSQICSGIFLHLFYFKC